MADEQKPTATPHDTPKPQAATPQPELDERQEQQVREAMEAHPLLTREKAIRMLREFGF